MLGNLLLAALLCSFTLKTSFYDLIGDEAGLVSAEIKEGTKDTLIIIGSSDSAVKSQQAVKSFAEYVTRELSDGGADDPPRVISGAFAAGVRVCDEDAELLKTEAGRAKIARRALRRYIASPLPPLFKPREDPFGLKERWVMAMGASTNAVMPVMIGAEIASDLDRLVAFAAAVRKRAAEVNAADKTVKIRVTGVPMHTAATAARCRREIGYLTVFSLAFIAALSILVFKSFKWLPLLAVSLTVAAAAGGAAIFLIFDSVHLMTIVFGTTVMGLVIDYSFHWLMAAEDSRRATLRSLLLSWLTTEIGLIPLMISSLAVLRQTAVFLAVALAAALALVIFTYPRRRVKTAVMCVLAIAGVVGCERVGTDIERVYCPPAELLEADRIMSELWGQTPKCAENVAKLYAEHADRQFAALGIGDEGTDPEEGLGVDSEEPRARLTAALKELTDESLRRLVMALGLMLVALLIFLRTQAFRTFMPSLIAIAAVAVIVLATAGKINLFHLLAMFLLAGMSIDYTIFIHGVGRGSGAKSLSENASGYKSAACSLLTSMAGFGALYFVSFPVVSSFGLVLGLGLPIAFGTAMLTRRGGATGQGPESGKAQKGKGDGQVEQAAFPLGMEILWWCYRLLGRGVMRLACAVVAEVVWLSSRKVRSASPNRRKVVHFAWSLADKLVVMSEGRRLPQVVIEESEAAREFVKEVEERKGVFVLSSHVGTIEVLSVLAKDSPRFHAWMNIERTSVFNRFYLRHAKARKTVIHSIAEIGMASAFAAGDWLDKGECLVMAGDRGEGAFRFARAMGHSVYFVACLAERGGYRAVIRRMPMELSAMKAEYAKIRAELIKAHPEQLFEWEGGR